MPVVAAVGACAFIATASMPANATASSQDTMQFAAAITAPAQKLVVSDLAAPATLVRDSYTATAYVAPAPEPEPVVSSSAGETSRSFSSAPEVASGDIIERGRAIIAYAEQYVGVVPYSTGNTPDAGFMCDGLTQWVYGQFGLSLPRGADAQASTGTIISQSDAIAGDLVWWPDTHVGIYDGNGGMIDSPDWGRLVQHAGGLWGDPVFVRIL